MSKKRRLDFEMSEPSLRSSSAAGEVPTSPKRRKLRKGTQSCWECKRRKIRCTFAAPTEAICDGCRSRRTKCISQEFDDETARASREVDRLSRMESLMEKLVNQSSAEIPAAIRRDQLDKDPVADQINSTGDRCSTGSELPDSSRVPVPGLDLRIQVNESLDDLCKALLAVWPSQHDLDLILSVPVGVSVLLHGVVCMPYSKFFSKPIASPRSMLKPPQQGCHPVIIARKLLMLGTLLQGIPPGSVGQLVGMSLDYRTLMSRVVNVASRLVTSNDELVGSLEGIECIMIESMYLNNAGNLRRAWVTNRRAMVMAQMMGLHTGTSSPSMVLEADTRDHIDLEYMWFRIVTSDRYLSLMLGLPQGSLENVFASPKALESCMAMERMERLESAAAGLILQRNGVERTDLAATYKIDKMLQEAVASMSPQWWLKTPDLTAISSNDAKAFEETIRLVNQLAHHHLLVQLHLPYMMLSSSTDTNYDYSKMTAANASRAIVAQFVSFRNSTSVAAYCRGIDFIAFIASTTLCLAHIEARRQKDITSDKYISVFQSLQHQRPSDRGLLERTLEIMQTMAEANNDVVAQKISSILKPLLDIENNSAKGACYNTSSSDADKQESQSIRNAQDGFGVLHIQIPYFGTIKIEHRPIISNTIEAAGTLSEDWVHNASKSQATDADFAILCEPISRHDREKQKEHQGPTASAARPVGYEISNAEPINTDWQAVPSLDQPDPLQQLSSTNWESSFDTNGIQEAHLLVPGLAADVSDWALQGVDMALFSNLTQGSVDTTETRSWPPTE